MHSALPDISTETVPSLAVVVPAYNEQDGIIEGLCRIDRVLRRLPTQTELIVVEDGSSDETLELLEKAQLDQPSFVLVPHITNLGFGAALVSGAKKAKELGFDYVLFMDSDMTNPPEHIERFLTPMLDGYDVIKASRYHKDGAMIGVAWPRDLISRLAGLIARCLFRLGVKDCTNGFHAIQTNLFLSMKLTETGFAILMEELYWIKAWNCSVIEIPTVLNARQDEQSPSKFRLNVNVIINYLKHAIPASFVVRGAHASKHPGRRVTSSDDGKYENSLT